METKITKSERLRNDHNNRATRVQAMITALYMQGVLTKQTQTHLYDEVERMKRDASDLRKYCANLGEPLAQQEPIF